MLLFLHEDMFYGNSFGKVQNGKKHQVKGMLLFFLNTKGNQTQLNGHFFFFNLL